VNDDSQLFAREDDNDITQDRWGGRGRKEKVLSLKSLKNI
jgi:hypothetical protein